MADTNTAPVVEITRVAKPRGFAAISPERRREIASLGGRSVPKAKRSFSQNPELASTAGRKGGQSRKRAA
jgi:hypothetical protein